jgi:hypothetical protein
MIGLHNGIMLPKFVFVNQVFLNNKFKNSSFSLPDDGVTVNDRNM